MVTVGRTLRNLSRIWAEDCAVLCANPWRMRSVPDATREPAVSASATAPRAPTASEDRKSTRLNSSHTVSSYAVFCLKKKDPGRAGRLRDARDRAEIARVAD